MYFGAQLRDLGIEGLKDKINFINSRVGVTHVGAASSRD
jgi:hypothetical protein